MKRIFLFAVFVLMAISIYAINTNDKTIVVDLEKEGLFKGIQVYYVPAGTETAASIKIGRDNADPGEFCVLKDTITLTVAGGLRPGSTWWAFNDTAIRTSLSAFEEWIEAKDSSGTGTVFTQTAQNSSRNALQGEWVITQMNTGIALQPTGSLATQETLDVLLSTQTIDLVTTTATANYNAFTAYYVAAGTETSASIKISRDSGDVGEFCVLVNTITLTVQGGLRPGSTWWTFSDSAITTLGKFESWIESKDSSATASAYNQANQDPARNALQGEWVITQINSARAKRSIEILADTDNTVFASTPTTFTMFIASVPYIRTFNILSTSATYFEYSLPATRGRNTSVQAIISSVTHTGSGFVRIHNSQDTAITPSFYLPATGIGYLPATSIPGPLAIDYTPEIRVFTDKSDMSEYLTRGWLYIIYKVD